MILDLERLKPYFEIAEKEAKKSPCTRRKYAALIVKQGYDIDHVVAYNERISHCCDGYCVRTRLGLSPGERTEIGAEIHAEINVLIKHGPRVHSSGGWIDNYFVLVGYDAETGKQIFGHATYPCHACALAIKLSGFKFIYIKNDAKTIVPVSVAEILEEAPLAWNQDG